jgi:hypothetical protein
MLIGTLLTGSGCEYEFEYEFGGKVIGLSSLKGGSYGFLNTSFVSNHGPDCTIDILFSPSDL